ncbi:MAG: thioredoxin family protein [Archangium gephyra]|uniref:Thioredoxin family protein n=1 Tax=Archangium gephyra TaxID=48 RepID=A0A2W5TPZ3_9BACT|nr:MAG: thioredoxin family protein [Archangium gephyra]
MPTTIHVYRKPGCSLCDEALELLTDVSDHFEFEVQTHNILEDEALFSKYRYRVPVLLIDGIERLELRFDEGQLDTVLRAAKVPIRE